MGCLEPPREVSNDPNGGCTSSSPSCSAPSASDWSFLTTSTAGDTTIKPNQEQQHYAGLHTCISITIYFTNFHHVFTPALKVYYTLFGTKLLHRPTPLSSIGTTLMKSKYWGNSHQLTPTDQGNTVPGLERSI